MGISAPLGSAPLAAARGRWLLASLLLLLLLLLCQQLLMLVVEPLEENVTNGKKQTLLR
jgi:hypothetical protein